MAKVLAAEINLCTMVTQSRLTANANFIGEDFQLEIGKAKLLSVLLYSQVTTKLEVAFLCPG